MKKVLLRIAGADVAAADGRSYEKRCGYSGEAIADVADAGVADARAAVDAAHAAFPAWSSAPFAKRRTTLWKAADLLEARAAEVAELITLETGGTFGWGMFNAGFAASILRESAAVVSQVQGEVIPSNQPGLRALTVRRPAGVVVAIAPWNAPLILGVRAVAMPLACGNTVVLKASEETPLCHRLIAAILEEAGLAPGVLNVLTTSRTGAANVVDALIADRRVRRVNFTGSTHVGRIIAEKAAQHLKPALLELGGKAPQIVLEDADLDEAAAAASFGAFMHQGQICMSTERVLVHESVKDAFVDKLVAKAKALRVGDPKEKATQIGPMIQESAAQRVKLLIDDARKTGASLLCGGEPKGAFFPPTVLDKVGRDARIYREESFGPVVIVLPFKDDDDAVELANDTEYGLSACVFSRNIDRAWAVAQRIDSGMCHINSSTVNDEPQMPFGGVKASGVGRFGGQAGINEFTDLRWITIQTGHRHYPI
jgi:acyl-CoA reductase-like NAD-dependent aldehyde dehydrogenase